MTSPPEPGRKVALSGSLWSAIGLVSSQGLRLGGNLVLAYLLFPEAFGVIALVNIFFRGAEMFSDFGIWRSVTQNERGAESSFLDTAWTLQAIRGGVLWGIACALAHPFASLYEEPMLASYVMVGGIALVLRGLESPSILLLRREMVLRELTYFELAAQGVALTVMIVWAAIDPSVWAFVAGNVSGALARLVLSHAVFRRHRPRFGWDPAALAELVRLGKWIVLSSIFTFLAAQSDRLLLGRLISKAELGIYGIALGYTGLTVQIANRLLNTVLFPILSRRQRDPERMTSTFLEARRYLLTFSAGVCCAIAIGAPVFFEVLYDERYVRAGYYAQWLVCSAWAGILVCGVDLVPLSMGDSKVQFLGNTIRATGFLFGALGFALGGVPGLVCGYALSSVLALGFLTTRLPARRRAVLTQSVLFSAALAVYLAVSYQTLSWLGDEPTRAARYGTLLALAAVPLSVSAASLVRNVGGRRD